MSTPRLEMDPLGYETGSPPLQRANAGGRVLTFRESGYDNPRIVVLLHGVGSGAASWGPQFVSLPQYGLRVIAWDAPGYGGSDRIAASAPTAADYAAVLGDFVDALGLKRFVLVGHSLGTLVAAAYASRAGAARVEKLVLAAPTAGYLTASDEVRTARIAGRVADMASLGPSGLAEKRTPNLLSAAAPPRAFMLVRAVMRELRPDGYGEAVAMLGASDIFADAAHIAVPTLVLCGTGDAVTPEAGCRRIAAAIPSARFEALPGPGHALYIEAPGPFDAALLRFIGAP